MRTNNKNTDKPLSIVLVVLALLTAQILPIINTLTEDYSFGDVTPVGVYFKTLGSIILVITPSALITLYLSMWIVKRTNKQIATYNTKEK